ncbi:hypothetical protein PYCCODRAFT_1440476 [Trametes coccinea BRFM310]|uniref:Replication protein A C-terminal domain-containing protein n=1 Tax=Trametes coccinea (strain BRFM310) TaxID=1353009 RepID=A0A1Y2I7K0_TRAC3|nr:hypothetical protein PYCCODRAFT_1440476 [Trametes coccinea BRFM310]
MPTENAYTSPEVGALRRTAHEGIRPVTIRQLANATRLHSSAPFAIDGIEVHEIKTVAHVVGIRRYPTVTLLDLEDGTSNGWITAKRWLNGQDTDGLPTDKDNFYVHITGELVRASGDSKTTLTVRSISVVTDPHQLLLHILEAAFVTLALERGPPTRAAKQSVGSRTQALVRQEEDEVWPPGAPVTPAVSRTFKSGVLPGSQVVPRSPAARSPPPSPSPSPRPPQVRMSPTQSSAHRQPTTVPSSPRSPTPIRQGSNAATGPRIATPARRRDPAADLSALERAILLKILGASPGENAVSVVTITRAVGHHNVAAHEIGAALDALVDKGYISASEDGNHYSDAAKSCHYPILPS